MLVKDEYTPIKHQLLLISSIKTMEGTQESTTKELIESKTQFRKGERQWMAEKEFLMRKVQFLQTYGSVVPPSIDGGGFFTEDRSNKRRGGELKGKKMIFWIILDFFGGKKIIKIFFLRVF